MDLFAFLSSLCRVRFTLAAILLFVTSLIPSQQAEAVVVAQAGIAYAGDAVSISQRFPYSKHYESTLGPNGLDRLVRDVVAQNSPAGYDLVSRIDELTGADQAISVAMVVTNETVSTETYDLRQYGVGLQHKLLVQVRAQALFFDFKSMTVLRAYPFSFAYLHVVSDGEDIEAAKQDAIRIVYQGTEGRPGILSRYALALQRAELPSYVTRYLQVSDASVADELQGIFPEGFRSGGDVVWLADTFAEALSSTVGVPVLPYAKGYAIGNKMSMTVADGTVFTLAIPSPDYAFGVNLLKLKRFIDSDQPAGTAYIYGALTSIVLDEPLSGERYLNATIKNGEVKVVPRAQKTVDDFPAYQESIRRLFEKLSEELAGKKSAWLKSATEAKDIADQVKSTRELLQSCK